MAQAQDCLVAALGGYVGARHVIPRGRPWRVDEPCSRRRL